MIRLAMILLTAMMLLMLSGCEKPAVESADGGGKSASTPGAGAPASTATPTNRVDIPAAVRQNLGITFARVESRDVARTLRVPGRFELLPTARRECRTPLSGRVELLVKQYQRVEAGTPLFRVDSAAWLELNGQIAATRARVEAMVPLRRAHEQHERSLEEMVTLRRARVGSLEALVSAGGVQAGQLSEARGELIAAEAEVGEQREQDAELEAQQSQSISALRVLEGRRGLLLAGGGGSGEAGEGGVEGAYVVSAVASGVVEMIGITPGGLAEENGLVLTMVQPEQVRFRARAMQSDLGRLRDGLAARIAPARGGSVAIEDSMTGELRVGLTADADERTVDLLVEPEKVAAWARAGVSAHLEVTLEGGTAELAIPLSCITRDGTRAIIFRRDPANPDKAIRMDADVGINDGRWVVIGSGVKEGDEIVLDGVYQLMLATAGNAPKGGHFHSDGTFHEGEDH